jgi:hypothetical protein
MSPAASSLAPNEPKAPISILTPAKRAALMACLSGGTLEKQRGVWTPSSGGPCDKRISGITVADLGRDGMPSSGGPCDKRISGITVADLGRDGMLSVTILGRHASAHLTTRGSWFARTLVAETVAQDTAQQKHHGSAP